MTDNLAVEVAVSESIEELHRRGEALAALKLLHREMQQRRDRQDKLSWKSFCSSLPGSLVSELRELLPVSSRCYNRPRGVSADPVALDWLCGVSEPPESNRLLLDWERSLSFARSIQSRRDFAAKELEDCFRLVRKPRVLSVHNGRISETQDVLPWLRISGGEFLALDSDAESSDFVEKTFGPHGVSAVCASETNGKDLGAFDFIYSLGHLDRLKSSSARAFLANLAAMLKPGGRLLVGNFSPEMEDSAYLEAVMDWWPVYRTEEEIAQLTEAIPDELMIGHVVFRDDPGNIVFLEIQR